MKKIDQKILAEFMAGIFGGTVFGFISLFYSYLLPNSGAINIVGTIFFVLLGVLVVNKTQSSNYRKFSIWFGIGAFAIPLLFLFITSIPVLKYLDSSMLKTLIEKGIWIPAAILFYMAVSAIFSLIITGLVNSRKVPTLTK